MPSGTFAHRDTLLLVLDFALDTRDDTLHALAHYRSRPQYVKSKHKPADPSGCLASCARVCKLFADVVKIWLRAHSDWHVQLAIIKLFPGDPSKTALLSVLPQMRSHLNDPRLQPRRYKHATFRTLCTSFPLNVLRQVTPLLLGKDTALGLLQTASPYVPEPRVGHRGLEQDGSKQEWDAKELFRFDRESFAAFSKPWAKRRRFV
jgi:hypothetical protein